MIEPTELQDVPEVWRRVPNRRDRRAWGARRSAGAGRSFRTQLKMVGHPWKGAIETLRARRAAEIKERQS